MQRYYLSKNGQHVGPYSFDEVCKKLESQEHSWMDYVFDDTQKDWILLIEHPVFSQKFNTQIIAKPASHQKSKQTDSKYKDKEWFILRNGSNAGPFSQLELIQMLQEQSLFEYDYIWHQTLNSWKKLAEVDSFKPDRIKALKESGNAEMTEVFFRRRHLRAQYGCSLIVHDNKTIFKGESLEIGAGGAGLLIDNPHLKTGQTVYLHFQPGDGVPPFNAVCNIVSKQRIESTTNLKPLRYGVRFTSVSQMIREQIRDYTNNKKAA